MEDAIFFKWFKRLLILIFIVICILFLTGRIKINVGQFLIGRLNPYEAVGRYRGDPINSEDIIGRRNYEDGELIIYSRLIQGLDDGYKAIGIDFIEKTFYGYYWHTGNRAVVAPEDEGLFVLYNFFPSCNDGLLFTFDENYSEVVVDGEIFALSAIDRGDIKVFYQRLGLNEIVDFKYKE